MNTRALLPLLPLLTGCIIVGPNDDSDDNADETSGDGDGDPTGDGDGDPSGDGDGDPSGDGDGDPSGDGDGDPSEEWCGLEQGLDEPWFALNQAGQELQTGSDLAVECGFQGSFMIEINPDIGGFIPESEYVSFQVTIDVEGYNVGPNNHFAAGDFNIFVACCDYDEYEYGCYYEPTTFQIFPPDGIDDLSVIHGVPGTISVTMDTPQGPISQTLDVSMWAMEQGEEWQYCSYDYPSVDPLPLATPPIPGAP